LPQKLQDRLRQFFDSVEDLELFVAKGGLQELSQLLPHLGAQLRTADIISVPQVLETQKLTMQVRSC
jgi:hypothetical protein